MNYIDAAKIKSECIKMFGEDVIIERLSLLGHYALKELEDKILSDDYKEEFIDNIFEYIKIASNCGDRIYEIAIEDVPNIFSKLWNLNSTDSDDLLPWQVTYNINALNRRTNADYTNRQLAIIVNILASRYGWDINTIHNLTPELAACYVQEALLDDWNDKEFIYKLSELAYDSKNGNYKEFPKLAWLTEIKGPTVEEAKSMIPSRFAPTGVIYDPLKERQDKISRKENNSNSSKS